MFIWILSIIAALCLLVYFKLFIKRFLLLKKLKNTNPALTIQHLQNPLKSVFCPTGKIEILIKEKKLAISVLTTPFQRVRYHFIDENRLEIVRGRQSIFIANPQSRSKIVSFQTVSTIKKYALLLKAPDDYADMKKILLIHPVPRELSCIHGNRAVPLGNGDTFREFEICALSYFCEQYLKPTSATEV